jgi:SAM-dependent methyltransferase
VTEPARRTYTYGDSAVAGDRLAVLASIFGPTTAAFLARDATPGAALALDLGCGPGYTTVLLHDVASPIETVGLERSDAFVRRARVEHTTGGAPHRPGLRFLPHDVTVTPFPTGPADLVFARYLLAHLPEPVAVRDRWLTQVRPGGRLLLEEIDHIDTSIPTFERYLEVVTAMSAGHDADLRVGGRLAAAPPPAGARLVADSLARISPDPRQVARIFSMNLSVWRDDPWTRANVDDEAVTALDDELTELARSGSTGAITWHHRQLVYARGG